MQLKNLIPEYLPARNDTIDENLAKYIYARNSELRIMFIRIKP